MLNEIFQADFETWKQYLTDYWYVPAIALAALLIVIRIVKTMVKWALVAVILIGTLLYSGYTLDDLSVDNLKSIGAQALDSLKQEAVAAMAGEASEATYTDNGDGTFTVKTASLELTGKPGEGEVSVKFNGAPLGTWKIDDAIASLIEQAKAAA